MRQVRRTVSVLLVAVMLLGFAPIAFTNGGFRFPFAMNASAEEIESDEEYIQNGGNP